MASNEGFEWIFLPPRHSYGVFGVGSENADSSDSYREFQDASPVSCRAELGSKM
jgi:hypothetical protein